MIGDSIPELLPQVSFMHKTDPFKSFNPTLSIAIRPQLNSYLYGYYTELSHLCNRINFKA